MNTIKLADGTELHVGLCGASFGILSIHLLEDMTLLEAAELFSDGTKTATITQTLITGETVYTGYTDLVAVISQRFTNSELLIQLGKENQDG